MKVGPNREQIRVYYSSPLLYHTLHYGQADARIDALPKTFAVNAATQTVSNSRSQQMSSPLTHASDQATSAHMERALGGVGSAPTSLPSSFPSD